MRHSSVYLLDRLSCCRPVVCRDGEVRLAMKVILPVAVFHQEPKWIDFAAPAHWAVCLWRSSGRGFACKF